MNNRQLKSKAKKSALFRGHRMSNYTKTVSGNYQAHCIDCNALVMIVTDPNPNESPIMGSAVTVHCMKNY